MTNYGQYWQASKRFDADFKAWLLNNADDTSTVFSVFAFFYWLELHLESQEELLCAFCVANVDHLSSARVVRARLHPFVSSENQRFKWDKDGATRFQSARCTTTISGKDCKASLLVPKVSAAQTETAALLVRPHKHQRVSERYSIARLVCNRIELLCSTKTTPTTTAVASPSSRASSTRASVFSSPASTSSSSCARASGRTTRKYETRVLAHTLADTPFYRTPLTPILWSSSNTATMRARTSSILSRLPRIKALCTPSCIQASAPTRRCAKRLTPFATSASA